MEGDLTGFVTSQEIVNFVLIVKTKSFHGYHEILIQYCHN
jgi:hypothetical protein